MFKLKYNAELSSKQKKITIINSLLISNDIKLVVLSIKLQNAKINKNKKVNSQSNTLFN